MAFSIILKDTEFSQSIGNVIMPDRSGLVAEYIFGEDQTQSVKNRAGGALATVVGSPTYGENYITTTSGSASHGLDTGLVVPRNPTVIIVNRAPSGFPVVVGDPTLFGFVGAYSSNTVFNTQLGGQLSVAGASPHSTTEFRFHAGVFPLAGQVTVRSVLDGVSTPVTASVAGNASRGDFTIKIGTTLTAGSGTGVSDTAYVAIFDRLLTEAEVLAAYASIKSYLGTRGIAVA